MPRLTIDNQEVEVPDGATILDAARKLGIEIPTLCFRKGIEPNTSCMVCVVKVHGMEALQPACAAPATDGMRVESDTDEVRDARRIALELLLSDHLGDCDAPCHIACPARMNIPRMIRQIAAGDLRAAIATVKRDIALPAVLGRICPAPCEKACRRGAHDAPLAICLLKRYVADADLASGDPYVPQCEAETHRRVAVVGAGPAGLAAAYHLRQCGHGCTLFDERELPGGMLRYGLTADRLPREVLDAEIDIVRRLGAKFRMETRVETDVSLDDLRSQYDAVIVAVGEVGADADRCGLPASAKGVLTDPHTGATGVAGVFAAGNAVRAARLAVRAVQNGKVAAASVHQHLSGAAVTGLHRPFSVHVGRVHEGEMESFLREGSGGPRVTPSGREGGLTDDEARIESLRCLHCDCRKRTRCALRDHADAHGAAPGAYRSERRTFEQFAQHAEVVYEPGKCIDCGLCVKITEQAGERLGLTFIGRGFDVRVAPPFDAPLSGALTRVAADCVEACPTGALAFRDDARNLPGREEARQEEK